MKITRTQTSKLNFKIGKIVSAFGDGHLQLNNYERETTYSIGMQIKENKLMSLSQKQFIDDLHKRAVEATSLRVSLR